MCRPAAIVHGNVFALAHSGHSLARALVASPFQSVTILRRPKNKMILSAFFGTDLKTNMAQGEFTLYLPRSSTLDLPPPLPVESGLLTARFPLCERRPCRNLARGGACLRK